MPGMDVRLRRREETGAIGKVNQVLLWNKVIL
jgi:hypothetical protein